MYLGLDLRGGVHFLMQVDMKSALTKRAEAIVGDVRTLLRDKNLRHSGISRDGNNVELRFRDEQTLNAARDLLSDQLPDLAWTPVADGTEPRLRGVLKPEAAIRTQQTAIQQNITTLHNRVNELGVAEPVIQQQGPDRVVVQLPGVQDTAKAKDIIGRTATLELRMVDDSPEAAAAAGGNAPVPFGTERYVERGGSPLIVKRQVILTGDSLTDAQAGFDGQTQEPAVHLTVDAKGARIMRDISRENIGKRMAILLFEKGKGEVVTAPVIRGELGGALPDLGAHDDRRGQRYRAAAARRITGRADGDHRGAHDRPEPGRREHRQGLQQRRLRIHRHRDLHVGVLPAVRGLLHARAGVQPAAADGGAVDAAGDADAAGLRSHRTHAGHGDRRQRADQRTGARGTAPRCSATGGDQPGLRAGLRHHLRLEHHDADRRRGAARIRLRSGARLRGGPCARHPDLHVLGGDVLARARQSLVRPQEAAQERLDRPGLEARPPTPVHWPSAEIGRSTSTDTTWNSSESGATSRSCGMRSCSMRSRC